jgi:VacB/RNase II family 3'-5' exoribonuclease
MESPLVAIARRAMIEHGLEPDLPQQALAELVHLNDRSTKGLRDLREIPWSSIDNDESRDLDQLEVCVDGPRSKRLLIAIADVDALVVKHSALDDHARTNTTSVYTPARVFPMLPPELSNDRTSLNPDTDRAAVVVDMEVDDDGRPARFDVYRAVVRNHAKLAYEAVAAWLDGRGAAPAPIAGSPELERQVRDQDAIASRLRAWREEEGALDFDRTEIKPILDDGGVRELRTEGPNRARDIIESFMIAANGATARYLAGRGVPSIRRVVKSPERWPRIQALAAEHGGALPADPDARALQAFLKERRTAAPDDFGDLSLSIIKLLGRGEYVAELPGRPDAGHFALATSAYTHSTAPNRRYPDLVTQRLVKAALDGREAPYSYAELQALAAHCTQQEDAANKVERQVKKAAAALWLRDRVGEEFDAVVTGASPKGTWARLCRPPVEGRVERGFQGLDVGDRIRVRLIGTNPERGFIDFERVGTTGRKGDCG